MHMQIYFRWDLLVLSAGPDEVAFFLVPIGVGVSMSEMVAWLLQRNEFFITPPDLTVECFSLLRRSLSC